jgi:hypothetical protein
MTRGVKKLRVEEAGRRDSRSQNDEAVTIMDKIDGYGIRDSNRKEIGWESAAGKAREVLGIGQRR